MTAPHAHSGKIRPMRTYHPGKASDTGQPCRAAVGTATLAPRLHAAVHRSAVDNVFDSPASPSPPVQEEMHARFDADFSRIPVHPDNTARDSGMEVGVRACTSGPHVVLGSPGQPLPAPLKEEMEARFGADFSEVRLHTDSAAHASAALLGARAYTSGRHIVFGDTSTEKRTLAHELTHVLQQRQGPVPGIDLGTGPKVSDPGDRLEKEAEATAAQVMAGPVQAPAAGHHRPVSRAVGATVQRLLVAQITSRDGVTVGDLNIAGRPESPYTGSMGDHSTAFAVQLEAIRRRVLGLDRGGVGHERGPWGAAQAARAIQELISEVEKLPGAQLIENLPEKQKKDIKDARERLRAQYNEFVSGEVQESTGLLKIQKMVSDFLHYRELIPLTTMNRKVFSPATAGKAKGESRHNKVLADYANGQTDKEPGTCEPRSGVYWTERASLWSPPRRMCDNSFPGRRV